jgi:hypothetical protein
MNNGYAIIIAGALIALAVLVTFRWHISTLSGGPSPPGNSIYRLDRWTGTVTKCDDQWVPANGVGAIKLDCSPR